MGEVRVGFIRIAAVLVVLLAPSLRAAAQSLPAGHPEALGMSGSRLARVDSVMQTYVDSSRAAGISVMVLRDGRVVKSGTYGWADREARRTLELDALFRIASQSKAITSVAVMMLVEEGKIRLEDPVHRWLPSFANASVAGEEGRVPARRPVTIRHLLTHSSGISTGGEAAIRDAYRAAGFATAAEPCAEPRHARRAAAGKFARRTPVQQILIEA
jgi:CubicO group peptidase (beta-lactamase class C family)